MNVHIGDIIRAVDDSPALFVYSIDLSVNRINAINLYNSSLFSIFVDNLSIYERISQACLDEVERFYYENKVSSYINTAKLNCLLYESIRR